MFRVFTCLALACAITVSGEELPQAESVSVESHVLIVKGNLGPLGELVEEESLLLSGELLARHAFDRFDLHEVELLSAPRITMFAAGEEQKLFLRDQSAQPLQLTPPVVLPEHAALQPISSKLGRAVMSPAPQDLVRIHERFEEPTAIIPADIAERNLIADLNDNGHGVVISLKAESNSDGQYQLDYLFQFKDNTGFYQFQRVLEIPKGESRLVAMPYGKKRILAVAVTAEPALETACKVSSND